MKGFIRKMYLSAVISSCILFGICAVCVSYEKMRLIGFGEYRKAVEITQESIKIFDYEIEFKK